MAKRPRELKDNERMLEERDSSDDDGMQEQADNVRDMEEFAHGEDDDDDS